MELYTIDTPLQDLKQMKIISTSLANALLRGYDYRQTKMTTYDVTLRHIAEEYTIAEIYRFRNFGEYKFAELQEIYLSLGYAPKDGKFQPLSLEKNNVELADNTPRAHGNEAEKTHVKSKTEPTILPCPFCRSNDIGVKDNILEERACCYCRNCHAKGPVIHISKDSNYTDEQIIALSFIKWNERQ